MAKDEETEKETTQSTITIKIDRFDAFSEDWKKQRNAIYAMNKKCSELEMAAYLNTIAEVNIQKRPPILTKSAQGTNMNKLPPIKLLSSSSTKAIALPRIVVPSSVNSGSKQLYRNPSGKLRRLGGV